MRANLPGWSASVTQVIGVPEPTFRVIVNRSRACPPLAGLPAVILVRHFCGGLEGLPAITLAGWPEFFVEGVIV